jgi:hypothetical protein
MNIIELIAAHEAACRRVRAQVAAALQSAEPWGM